MTDPVFAPLVVTPERLGVATNAIAWAMFSTGGTGPVTITADQSRQAQRVARHLLVQLETFDRARTHDHPLGSIAEDQAHLREQMVRDHPEPITVNPVIAFCPDGAVTPGWVAEMVEDLGGRGFEVDWLGLNPSTTVHDANGCRQFGMPGQSQSLGYVVSWDQKVLPDTVEFHRQRPIREDLASAKDAHPAGPRVDVVIGGDNYTWWDRQQQRTTDDEAEHEHTHVAPVFDEPSPASTIDEYERRRRLSVDQIAQAFDLNDDDTAVLHRMEDAVTYSHQDRGPVTLPFEPGPAWDEFEAAVAKLDPKDNQPTTPAAPEPRWDRFRAYVRRLRSDVADGVFWR